VLGAIAGFLFGVFLGLDLWLFGVVRTDSVLLTVLPFLGLALGVALGLTGPLRRGRSSGASAPGAPPAPQAQ
jgi:hypothetical protein